MGKVLGATSSLSCSRTVSRLSPSSGTATATLLLLLLWSCCALGDCSSLLQGNCAQPWPAPQPGHRQAQLWPAPEEEQSQAQPWPPTPHPEELPDPTRTEPGSPGLAQRLRQHLGGEALPKTVLKHRDGLEGELGVPQIFPVPSRGPGRPWAPLPDGGSGLGTMRRNSKLDRLGWKGVLF